MLVREVMITNLSVVGAEADSAEIARKMLEMDVSHVLVVEGGKLLGLVSGYDLRRILAAGRTGARAAEIMTPREKLVVAKPDMPLEEVAGILTGRHITQLPVLDGERVAGYLDLEEVLHFTSKQFRKMEDLLDSFGQSALLIDAMSEGVVVVDRDFCIREFNAAAEKYSGCRADKLIGKRSRTYLNGDGTVRRVLESGEPLYGVEVQNGNGQVFLTNNVPIVVEGSIEGVLQTFFDITALKQMHHQLLKARDELDKAFALTLPNSRVEHKMKSTPEYRDNFNPGTGLIEITEVIEDGGYLHVVNALKVAADLNEKGLMSLVGIDKDTLVQALIFHDIGKSQPVLNVGQVVDPQRVFEASKQHAGRSADIVKMYYNKPEEVISLIRYHHHREDELPEDFPSHLLPMYRLMRIIDGLSAGLTRRQARIGFRVSGSRLMVLENTSHPDYNRTVEVDLYTGQEMVYTEKRVLPSRREALS